MARFEPNEAGIRHLLRGSGGPVFRHVEEFTKATDSESARFAPSDTGALRSSIHATSVVETIDGLESTVRAASEHGLVVHQGRGAIVPVSKPHLQFYWKRFNVEIGRRGADGRIRYLDYIKPRAGRPFFIEGMEAANDLLRVGRFRIRIARHWRTDGS